jgi:F-type H+-transporting ATPase subunit c
MELYVGIGVGYLAAGLGAGLAVIGGALGIGKLATAALEGIARQPEAVGDIRTTMIIAAALIEGFTFFAIVVTLLLAIKVAPVAQPEQSPVATDAQHTQAQ